MCYLCVWDFHTVWLEHNECVASNSYANDFGILLWSCAQKNYENLSIFVKVAAKKSVAPSYVDTVYIMYKSNKK